MFTNRLYQTALLFAQAMNAKLPRPDGIPPEVRSWSEFTGHRLM
jgi:carbamoyl-phosphate synthase large subunit